MDTTPIHLAYDVYILLPSVMRVLSRQPRRCCRVMSLKFVPLILAKRKWHSFPVLWYSARDVLVFALISLVSHI